MSVPKINLDFGKQIQIETACYEVQNELEYLTVIGITYMC